jgi:drug/metabolite transporter (DMT)-like permease
MQKDKTTALSVLAFCALGLIWGSNFIYMKMAAKLISPLQVVFCRVLFGFVPVLVYARMRGGLRREHLRYSGHFLVMALLATVLYYYAYVKGTSLLLSGVAGALSGAISLFTFVLAAIFIPEEKVTPARVLGLVVGFLGVLLIGRPTAENLMGTNWEGVCYLVAGSLSVGASFVYARKYIIPLNIPATALTTYQLGIGLVILALCTDYHGMGKILQSPHAAVGLAVGLGLLGTGLAYIVYYHIVEKFGAITASSVTYIPPVVALLIGALLAGEPIRLSDYGATLLIFAGVFLLKRN